MYLKSLELHGFKSFADRTKFGFGRGLTGIVGPNGCGKSNVVDAIRWVLGETSAKALRGGEMADVIFNGAETRKPLGMAEVTLTLADCEEVLEVEYNEVSVTRRVFRDGKSEYRLNGTLCRLRDIHDLFMDTGIGRTSYSIMEQGKIDMLLSSKPEDRRQVFEEAAGVTKFKKEKKEALRKLEYTEANLLRVCDVLEEQQKRMGSLQRQVAKARRYQSLEEDIAVLETHWNQHKYAELKAENGKSQHDLRQLKRDVELLTRALASKERDISKLRMEFESLEQPLLDLHKERNAKVNLISTSLSRIRFNTEREAELKLRITQSKQEIAEAQTKIEAGESNLVERQAELSGGEVKVDLLRKRGEVNNDAWNAARAKRQKAESKQLEVLSEHQRLQENRAAAQAKIENTQSQFDRDRGRYEQCFEEYQHLEKEIGYVEEAETSLLAGLEVKKAAFSELSQKLLEAEKESQQQRGLVSHTRKELEEMQHGYSKVSSRLEVLEQMLTEGQGLGEGTQAVLQGHGKMKQFQKSVSGILGQQIEVAEDALVALEAVLGEKLQVILVEEVDSAEAILSAVIEGELGSVALMPRDHLPNQSESRLIALPKGGLARLVDRVKTDVQVAPLFEHLLGEVLLTEDLSTALCLRNEMPGVSFVTREGVVLTADGVLFYGGVKGRGSSMLKRKNEICELTEQKAARGRSVEAKEQELKVQQEQLQEMLVLVECTREQCQEVRGEERELSGKMNLLQREKTTLKNRLVSLERECKELQDREKQSKSENMELKEVLETSGKRLDELKEWKVAFVTEFMQLKQEEEKWSEKLQAQKTELAVEERAHEAIVAQMVSLKIRLKEIKELVKRREQEVAISEEQVAAAGEENEELGERIKNLKEELIKIETDVAVGQERRTSLLEAVRQKEQGTVTEREKLRIVSDQRAEAELRLTKLELVMEKVREAMEEKHQVDICVFQQNEKKLSECLDRYGLGVEGFEIDWSQVEALFSKLRQSRDAIGAVNIDAIEEYEELDERYRFVSGQYKDLVESKEELTDVVDKINWETTKLFGQTFKQVRENFQSMFCMLFGETGQADLCLAEEEDLLESGIDIIVKPPGKSLQPITLLSGGERSMTAVALLFSIYQIKPSPFCVLDELDAPLDEANIGRFLRVLEHFIDKSQFITVTHSKRTMDRADVLYGITAEEKGVSKLIKMRLSNQKELPEDGVERAAAKAARQLDGA